ncbi:MAG: GDP-mannose 4,6-dehydratase [Chloroflexi bacterium]|nr:GDP-mannose 4,6-dehydratase [Chloroflexota bacterium]
MRIIVTGAAGFIGSHFCEHILKNTDWEIVAIDKLNYASMGFDRLKDIDVYDDRRVTMLTTDFTKPIISGMAKEIGQVDYIVHMGAETHVDNSITDPEPFVMSNVVGTMYMLEFAKTQKNLKAFVQFSTDEVYGPAPEGIDYKETDRMNATNPYSATKAGAEQLAQAYANCYGIPVMVTNTMNVFGERQHPEKFIPGTIRKILTGETVTIHSNPDRTKAGSRFYIHARNVASAIMFLFEKVKCGKPYYMDECGYPQYSYRYNVVGEKEVDNLTLAQFIAGIVGKPLKHEMVNFHESRPGHDLRYALSGEKLKEMGWEIPKTFEDSLRKTIEWSIANKKWLNL